MNQHLPQDAETLLASHAQRIALIRQYANEATPAEFDAKWLSVLRACANWFSTMPLQPELHSEPGGAFRATVEVAYFAMRLSGGQKFAADQPSERRRWLEPQYLYALFLAACCSWLDEPCRHFHFVREDTGEQWMPAAHGAFQPWLAENPYRVIRLEVALPVERMRSALLARSILGAESLSWLMLNAETDQARRAITTTYDVLSRLNGPFSERVDFLRRDNNEPAPDALVLTTMHSSKGLEWDRVWIIRAEETVVPDEKSTESEERRLFYVAVTRARDDLRLSTAKKNPTSRFVLEAGFG